MEELLGAVAEVQRCSSIPRHSQRSLSHDSRSIRAAMQGCNTCIVFCAADSLHCSSVFLLSPVCEVMECSVKQNRAQVMLLSDSRAGQRLLAPAFPRNMHEEVQSPGRFISFCCLSQMVLCWKADFCLPSSLSLGLTCSGLLLHCAVLGKV